MLGCPPWPSVPRRGQPALPAICDSPTRPCPRPARFAQPPRHPPDDGAAQAGVGEGHGRADQRIFARDAQGAHQAVGTRQRPDQARQQCAQAAQAEGAAGGVPHVVARLGVVIALKRGAREQQLLAYGQRQPRFAASAGRADMVARGVRGFVVGHVARSVRRGHRRRISRSLSSSASVASNRGGALRSDTRTFHRQAAAPSAYSAAMTASDCQR